MKKYIVKSGQNLYDIALMLYGSIEGVFDLLVSNPNISFNTMLSKNTELNYHEDFVVNQDIVSWFDTNNVRVKNGKYEISGANVRSEIIKWINENNQNLINKYLAGDLEVIQKEAELETPQPYDWDGGGTPMVVADISANVSTFTTTNAQLVPFTSQNKWNIQDISADTSAINKNVLQFAETISKADFEKFTQDDLFANLDVLFSNGMVTLPSDENEKQFYYDAVSTPKILIRQNGKSFSMGMQIPSNSFVAISWGDDSALDFYHYKKNTINATHTYNDEEEHTILVYGDNKFTNLDLTKISGIYYALSEIYISNDFISLYPNATTLNKLFIKKTIQ